MADKVVIQKSATIGVSDVTMADIEAAAKTVKAGENARVTTGGYYQPDPEVEALPYSVTFSWTE